MERDFQKNPYSADERRVVDYIQEITNGMVGGGDDPIGFLIASHQVIAFERRALLDNAEHLS